MTTDNRAAIEARQQQARQHAVLARVDMTAQGSGLLSLGGAASIAPGQAQVNVVRCQRTSPNQGEDTCNG